MGLSARAGGLRRLVGPDALDRVSEWIDMDHPAEELRHPPAVYGIAFALCEDRPFRAELCPIGRFDFALWRETDIHVSMPLCHAERNPLIERILVHPLGCCEHGPFQLIAVHGLLI